MSRMGKSMETKSSLVKSSLAMQLSGRGEGKGPRKWLLMDMDSLYGMRKEFLN